MTEESHYCMHIATDIQIRTADITERSQPTQLKRGQTIAIKCFKYCLKQTHEGNTCLVIRSIVL